MMASIYNPRQVVLVSCREEMEIMGRKMAKDNIITVAWHTPLSHDPRMYGIAIGKTRFSRKILDKAASFVVNFIGHEMAKTATKAGTVSGEHVDKFTACGLVAEECESIDAPRIKEALGWLECEVVDSFETGDHIFYVGKVVHGHQSRDDHRLFQLKNLEYTTTQE